MGLVAGCSDLQAMGVGCQTDSLLVININSYFINHNDSQAPLQCE